MKPMMRTLAPVVIIIAAGHYALADSKVPTGAITYAITGLDAGLTEYGKFLCQILSHVATALSGGRASIAAAKGEDWLTPLLLGIVAVVVFGALSS